jgi:hypothetical protein
MSNFSSAPDPSSGDLRRWYAVYTSTRHEKVVAELLKSKAGEVFLHTYLAENRDRGGPALA